MQPSLACPCPWLKGNSRNPLTGLSGLQPDPEPMDTPRSYESQSPYGAKWFATRYIGGAWTGFVQGRNPLTGLSGLQRGGGWRTHRAVTKESQSPYGAMWFATHMEVEEVLGYSRVASRNPLTGLCGLQQIRVRADKGPRLAEVAIPLRGYVVCNLSGAPSPSARARRRNPLTGLCGLQRKMTRLEQILEKALGSQSPYGAMWFAT